MRLARATRAGAPATATDPEAVRGGAAGRPAGDRRDHERDRAAVDLEAAGREPAAVLAARCARRGCVMRSPRASITRPVNGVPRWVTTRPGTASTDG